jgi:hypothetical protein
MDGVAGAGLTRMRDQRAPAPVRFSRGCGVEEIPRTATATPGEMPNPADLLRELEVADPGLKRGAFRRRSGSRARFKDSPAHHRAPFRDRARDWVIGRINRDALTEWLRSRFVPWLGDQTTRGTHASQAFWSALKPDERERLWNILGQLRRERRTALTSLEQRDVEQIAALVYRGLTAARQAWLGGASKKTK